MRSRAQAVSGGAQKSHDCMMLRGGPFGLNHCHSATAQADGSLVSYRSRFMCIRLCRRAS